MERYFKILVAEDEELSRTYMQAVLECCQVKSLIVNNGAEAIKALKEEEFDLLLLDCSMPVMDGWTTVKTIRDYESGTQKHLTVFALSGSALPDDEQRFKAAGMDGFLLKPLILTDLQKLINDLHNKTMDFTAQKVIPDQRPAFNREFIDERYANQPGLLHSLVKIYLNNSNELFDRLKVAVRDSSVQDCAFHAHKLKGMSANFGDSRLCTLLNSLEIYAASGESTEFQDHLVAITREFDLFKKELEQLL